MCPSCLDDWRSTNLLGLDVAREIKILQLEASKVPEKLSHVIDFMSSDSSSASLPSLSVNLNPCIKESPNRLHYYKILTIALEMLRQLLTTHPPGKPSYTFLYNSPTSPLHSETISQRPPVPAPRILIQLTHNHLISKLEPILAIMPNMLPYLTLIASQTISPNSNSNQEHTSLINR